MKFKKGQSGNPGGRPKDVGHVNELAKQYTEEAIERLAYWMRDGGEKASVAASTTILNRAWGTPAQSVIISGDADKPLVVKHSIG